MFKANSTATQLSGNTAAYRLLPLQLMLRKKHKHTTRPTAWPLCDANDALFDLFGITRITMALTNMHFVYFPTRKVQSRNHPHTHPNIHFVRLEKQTYIYIYAHLLQRNHLPLKRIASLGCCYLVLDLSCMVAQVQPQNICFVAKSLQVSGSKHLALHNENMRKC